MPDDDKRIHIRIPNDLHVRLLRISDAQDRSIQAQIIRWVREAVQRYEQEEEREKSD